MKQMAIVAAEPLSEQGQKLNCIEKLVLHCPLEEALLTKEQNVISQP